jgi:hypothetical protein
VAVLKIERGLKIGTLFLFTLFLIASFLTAIGRQSSFIYAANALSSRVALLIGSLALDEPIHVVCEAVTPAGLRVVM